MNKMISRGISYMCDKAHERKTFCLTGFEVLVCCLLDEFSSGSSICIFPETAVRQKYALKYDLLGNL